MSNIVVSIKKPNGKEIVLKHLTLDAIEEIEKALEHYDVELRNTNYGVTVASVLKRVVYKRNEFVDIRENKPKREVTG